MIIPSNEETNLIKIFPMLVLLAKEKKKINKSDKGTESVFYPIFYHPGTFSYPKFSIRLSQVESPNPK
jgi:hypothetical protein